MRTTWGAMSPLPVLSQSDSSKLCCCFTAGLPQDCSYAMSWKLCALCSLRRCTTCSLVCFGLVMALLGAVAGGLRVCCN